MSDHRTDYVKSAIALAKTAAREAVRPNPFVGALVINERGEIAGKGFHKKFGEAHAEVFAIREAFENGADLSTCTLIVTLEPCSHTGKTPPCTDLIISSGIKKVVVASQDPNPLVNGMEVLRRAGVEVILEESSEAVEMNAAFFINQRFRRPYIMLKAAITSDHFMARENGDSKWISSEESRKWAHVHCRSVVDAILTTANTVITDNAKLNVRIGEDEFERTTIVLDRKLDLLKRKDLSIYYPRKKSTLYLVTDNPEPIETEGPFKYIKGVYSDGEIELAPLFSELYRNHSIYSLLVEAGPRLLNRLLRSELADELIIFESPACFNNPTDRYRLDMPLVSLMKRTELGLSSMDKVIGYKKLL